MLAFDGVEVAFGLVETGKFIEGEDEGVENGAELVADIFLVSGGAEEAGGSESGNGGVEDGIKGVVLSVFGGEAGTVVSGFGGEFGEASEKVAGFLLDGLLFDTLEVKRRRLRGVEGGGGFAEIGILAGGEVAEEAGKFLEGLLALVDDEQAAECDDDLFLGGESGKGVFLGCAGIGRGAGGLEEGNDFVHFLVGQVREGVANGF